MLAQQRPAGQHGAYARSAAPVTPFPSHVTRSLPHSERAESNLIAAAFVDGNDVLTRAITCGVDAPDKFYDKNKAKVWAVMLDLYAKQQPISIDVIAHELERRKELSEIGGWPFLASLSEKAPTTLEATKWAKVVHEQALLREIIRSRTQSVEDCFAYDGELDSFLANLAARESSALDQRGHDNERTAQDEAESLLQDLAKPKDQRESSAKMVSWGIGDIDRQCGMMAPGDLVILAGAPSGGKSSMSDQAAWCCASSGKHVVMVTLEMSVKKKVIRLAQQISRLNIKQFDYAPMDRKLAFTEAVRQIKACKTLHIFERDRTVNRIIARCRALSRKGQLGLIVIDFLQYLARMEPTIGKERTDEKLGRITACLKSLGAECGCPVLVLSSLNRDGYREGATASMASLKNSGEIESDADVVAILQWPKTNPRTGADQDPHDSDQNTFFVYFNQEKGRDNGVAQVPLMFTRSATRFDAIAR